jgi:hypothetical protein
MTRLTVRVFGLLALALTLSAGQARAGLIGDTVNASTGGILSPSSPSAVVAAAGRRSSTC